MTEESPKRKRGRPKHTTGRSWKPRPRDLAAQILVTATQCGVMAGGVSGQTWALHCNLDPNHPQPRQYPPGSRRRMWVKEEVVNFLTNSLAMFTSELGSVRDEKGRG